MTEKINRSLLTVVEIKRIERASGGKIVATVTDEEIYEYIGTPQYLLPEGERKKSLVDKIRGS